MAYTEPRDWTDGEFVNEAMMDVHIRDNFRAMGPHLIIRKPSDESVTSNTTVQNDDHLLFAVAANEVWRFEMFVYWTATTAGDMRWDFTIPAGATGRISCQYPFSGSALTVNQATWVSAGSIWDLETQSTTGNLTKWDGLVINGGTAGNVQFQWAQKSSDGTPTVVKANSTLWAVKLA